MKVVVGRAIRSILLAGVLACCLQPHSVTADQQDIALLRRASKAFTEAAKSTIPSVVFIQVEQDVVRRPRVDYFNPFDMFGLRAPEERPFRRVGQGTGFIVSEDGYILSNHHIVGEADKITVRLHDGRELPAKLVGTDPQSEVAVIKVDAEGLSAAKLGKSDDLEIGEWVLAIGNPFGLSETVTVGIVSAKGRSGIGIADYEEFIQTDAAINPGNSGGPLVNLDGEVVGMNTAIYTRSGGYMGIGFAIPIDMAKRIKDQLIDSGRVDRGFLGVTIQFVTEELAASFGLDAAKGILISAVSEDSPAEKAGLLEGDIILSLDNVPVKNVSVFRNQIAAVSPGTEIKLRIFRDGGEKIIAVRTGAMPSAELVVSEKAFEITEKLGFAVKELTEEHVRTLGYKPEHGMIISDVASGSPAAEAGLRPGNIVISVNRQKVRTLEDFEDALSLSEETNMVLLRVMDSVGTRFIAFTLE